MEEQIFTPRYPTNHYLKLALGVLPAIAFLAFIAMTGRMNTLVLLGTLASVAVAYLLCMHHIKHIRFGEHLVVVRTLLRDRYFSYQEFSPHIPGTIVTPRGRIVYGGWKNCPAFTELLSQCEQHGCFKA